MNLTFVLVVLSAFVAYLIYDMFKKSRQEQQITQADQKPGNNSSSKLKPSYASECKILKELNEEKINAVKHKSVSIHLHEVAEEKGEVGAADRLKIQ